MNLGTATRTILFTDLAGYTARVSRSDREGLRKILEEHETMVRPIVERFDGRIVKNIGDAFLCVFDSATDALRASLDIVHHVHTSGQQSIRISMTTGDVEEIDGDVFGESVNLSARINSKAPGGEIWFGEGTRQCMNDAEIAWESVGRFRFKGIPGEQECYRAVPEHQCHLPDRVGAAAKVGNLVRFRRGARPPLLPPDPVIIFEGFESGTQELEQAVGALPVLNPASLFLAAYNVATQDRHTWTDTGRGLVVGTPEAIESAIQETLKAVTQRSGSDTIVLDVASHADMELVICGLALPAVPLSDVVASYSYDLLPDGRWVNRSDRSILRVEVRPDAVLLHALAPGVSMGGRGLRSGEAVTMGKRDEISTPTGTIIFVATDRGYAGALLADTEMRLGVVSGQTAELGREPNHPGLAFPDRRGQDNIRWCSGARAARARAGGFTLDRALAGRRQCAIQLVGESIQLAPLHARCPTYVLRDGQLTRAEQPMHVEMGDMVIAGTTVVGLREPE